MQTENIILMFSNFCLVYWKNRQKQTMACSSFDKIIRFPSLDDVKVFCVPGTVFNLNFSTFFSPKPKQSPSQCRFNAHPHRSCACFAVLLMRISFDCSHRERKV